MWNDHHRDESGVALVFALLAVIIVGGMAGVMLVRAAGQTTATRSERVHEQALHLAEAGVDEVIEKLNTDEEYVTTYDDDGDPATPGVEHVVDFPTDGTASQETERTWAVATATTSCDRATLDEGEVCAIRPLDAAGTPLDWLFGVSFTTDGNNDPRTRVIKMQFDEGVLVPTRAILTEGDLTLGGNLTIGGSNGTVHTNGDVTVNGGSVTTTGPVTSTGTFTGGCSSCGEGSGQVDDPETIVPISAEAAYYENVTEFEDDWYDLCSDGHIRRPGSAGPCTGPSVYDATVAGAAARYNGWAWSTGPGGALWSAGGGSGSNVSNAIVDGIYYIHNANGEISGNVGDEVVLTVMVDAEGVNRPNYPGHDSTCDPAIDGGTSGGSFTVRGVGGGDFESKIPGLLFLTDRDFVTTGNMVGTTLNGFIGAHEQIGIGGTPNVVGAVMAEDACPSSNNSPIDENSVSGNFTLTYDGLGGVPLSSVIRITAWNELS